MSNADGNTATAESPTARGESRNVADNIRALEEITNSPDKLDKAYL